MSEQSQLDQHKAAADNLSKQLAEGGWLMLTQACRELDLSPVTVTEWARMDKIPAVRVGDRNFLVQPAAIEAAIAAGVVGARIAQARKAKAKTKKRVTKKK